MHFDRGFTLTRKYYPLAFIPIVLDLLQIGEILRRVRDFSIRFTVPSAIPSLTQVLSDPPQTTGEFLAVNIPYSHLGGAFLILFLLSIMTTSFLKGGFLGCVLAGIRREEVSMNTLIMNGKKFFGRFLAQFLFLFFFMLFVVFFGYILGPLFLIVIIGLFFLFFMLIFWDYVIVAEDVPVFDAAQISLNLIKANLQKVFSFILPIVFFTAVFSIFANAMVGASPILAFAAIIIYAYIGTIVIFAMMSFYLDLTNKQ